MGYHRDHEQKIDLVPQEKRAQMDARNERDRKRRANRPTMFQVLRTTQDTNGNPRVAIIVYNASGDIVRAIDKGYRGETDAIAQECFGHLQPPKTKAPEMESTRQNRAAILRRSKVRQLVQLPGFNISPSDFREILRIESRRKG